MSYIPERFNHIDIISKAQEIYAIYGCEELKINKTSYLATLLDNIIKNYSDENTPLEVFNAIFVLRLHEAISSLKDQQDKNKFLKLLLKGSLDFFDREPSSAKNILFELEIAKKLSKKFNNIEFSEPDILVKFDDGNNVGIACKKVVSEKNLENQLSKGIKQIKDQELEFGIVAFNIDNLIPGGMVMQIDTFAQALEYLHKFNMDFITRNERYFKKYLESSRAIAIIVVSTVLAEIRLEKPQFNHLSQTTMWTLESLDEKLKNKVNEFRVLI